MSITRRILESAQSQLNKLTSLVIVDDEPLSYVESAALQTEITTRKAARARTPRAPLDNPLAKQALATPAARAARDKAAKDRAARIHKDRDEREAKQRAAADEAFRKMKEAAARGDTWSSTSTSSAGSSTGSTGGSTRTGPGGNSGAASGSARAPRSGSTEAQLAEWYRVLDLSPGAEMSQIKTSYRQLMRKYHPDMHAGNPQKQKAATELSVRVTAAYNGLVSYLEKK